MSFNFQEYFDELINGNVLLSYKGRITTDLINSVLDSIETKLQDSDEQSKVRKKVYNVLVESLQNLYHHNDDLPDSFKKEYGDSFGVLVIKKLDDAYKISTGNFIISNKIADLKSRIDKINSLSKEELKEEYKHILNFQKMSEKGGGGLGLVDIARKTGNKLKYIFHSFSEEYYFFSLDIFISN
ncbi:MAG: hypothetical protein IIB05_09325 [Bacteroidetes bacterium]|nr:hypothetical protein [Bacteroidota bacterium]